MWEWLAIYLPGGIHKNAHSPNPMCQCFRRFCRTSFLLISVLSTHNWDFWTFENSGDPMIVANKNTMLKWITSIFFDENSQWFQVSKLKSPIRSSNCCFLAMKIYTMPISQPCRLGKKTMKLKGFFGGHEPSGGGFDRLFGIMQWVYYTVFKYMNWCV